MSNRKPTIVTISGKMGAGKDTLAEYLKEELERLGYTVLITHYAGLLKYICRNFLEWNGEKDEAGRRLLQTVGTELFRKGNKDFFCNFLIEIMQNLGHQWDFVLIPDARFKNEVECMKSNFHTLSVLVTRPKHAEISTPNDQHISEHDLDGYKFDEFFMNDKGLEAIKEYARDLAERILHLRSRAARGNRVEARPVSDLLEAIAECITEEELLTTIINESISDCIFGYRDRNDLEREEVSRRCNVPLEVVTEWEDSYCDFSVSEIVKISTSLDIPMEILMGF